MDIVFTGRRTNVPERFRQHAEGKLAKIGKLDHKAIRMDVEITQERNPRQSEGRERVELTIRSRGPASARKQPRTTATPHSTWPSPSWRTGSAAPASGARTRATATANPARPGPQPPAPR